MEVDRRNFLIDWLLLIDLVFRTVLDLNVIEYFSIYGNLEIDPDHFTTMQSLHLTLKTMGKFLRIGNPNSELIKKLKADFPDTQFVMPNDSNYQNIVNESFQVYMKIKQENDFIIEDLPHRTIYCENSDPKVRLF